MTAPEQYPDTLTHAGGSVKCRFVPNIRGRQVTKLADGTQVVYAYDIAFPLDSPHLLAGTIVTATDKSGTYLVYQQELLKFHPGQLHNRGWV